MSIEASHSAAPDGLLCARDDHLMVKVVGDDRVSFLQGMLSNDIKVMTPGTIAYALALTDHAHVVGDLFVWAEAEHLWLEADRALWPTIREHLEKFLIADDVELEECEDLRILDILRGGPELALGSLAAGHPEPPPWRFVRDSDTLYANLPRFGFAATAIVTPADRCPELKTRLMGEWPGLREIALPDLEVLRVEAGYARVGRDTGERTLALEAGLDRGISHSKGCYLGQETIERATSRGGIRKRLCGLRIEGGTPAAPAPVMADGREVGQLTSVVNSPTLGPIGLGILTQNVWQAGTDVTVRLPQGELRARISELPFVPANGGNS